MQSDTFISLSQMYISFLIILDPDTTRDMGVRHDALTLNPWKRRQLKRWEKQQQSDGSNNRKRNNKTVNASTQQQSRFQQKKHNNKRMRNSFAICRSNSWNKNRMKPHMQQKPFTEIRIKTVKKMSTSFVSLATASEPRYQHREFDDQYQKRTQLCYCMNNIHKYTKKT